MPRACYIFFGVSILCDAHLCPALDKLCERLKIPTALAAATLLSFGSSAPELVISTIGAAGNKTELSSPAVLVSALIAFGAIPPMVVFTVGPITLHLREVVRDALCYVAALVMFMLYNRNPEIGALDASSLLAAYVVYLGIVWVSEKCVTEPHDCEFAIEAAVAVPDQASNASTASTTSETPKDSRPHDLAKPLLASEENKEEEEKEEDNEEQGCLMRILSCPFEVAFDMSIPLGAFSGFTMSMVWLSVLSYFAMECAEEVADVWQISPATAGVTLLAWGGQLPDAIAAVALAKDGKPDDAISQAIASQVINVSLGMGLPLLAYTLITGKPTVTSNNDTVSAIALVLIVSIVVYLAAMTPSRTDLKNWHPGEHKLAATITRPRAIAISLFFIVLYAGSITVGEFHHQLRNQ
eukprot:CAMPEP_0117608052 /NCGR_PEP_ID=MMETSP0784-20121206/80600_1 /TAXON_ID=39447 /ORGANISM="" /LENGTH=410 /DNA_ID=CAMNT_0005411295 /DNA_START=92 /DNA_END=1324 /DNA_ORIENTATION=+